MESLALSDRPVYFSIRLGVGYIEFNLMISPLCSWCPQLAQCRWISRHAWFPAGFPFDQHAASKKLEKLLSLHLYVCWWSPFRMFQSTFLVNMCWWYPRSLRKMRHDEFILLVYKTSSQVSRPIFQVQQATLPSHPATWRVEEMSFYSKLVIFRVYVKQPQGISILYIYIHNRKKFRRETSDNMDSWKRRGGKSQRGEEKKRRREKIRQEKKCEERRCGR